MDTGEKMTITRTTEAVYSEKALNQCDTNSTAPSAETWMAGISVSKDVSSKVCILFQGGIR